MTPTDLGAALPSSTSSSTASVTSSGSQISFGSLRAAQQAAQANIRGSYSRVSTQRCGAAAHSSAARRCNVDGRGLHPATTHLWAPRPARPGAPLALWTPALPQVVTQGRWGLRGRHPGRQRRGGMGRTPRSVRTGQAVAWRLGRPAYRGCCSGQWRAAPPGGASDDSALTSTASLSSSESASNWLAKSPLIMFTTLPLQNGRVGRLLCRRRHQQRLFWGRLLFPDYLIVVATETTTRGATKTNT